MCSSESWIPRIRKGAAATGAGLQVRTCEAGVVYDVFTRVGDTGALFVNTVARVICSI